MMEVPSVRCRVRVSCPVYDSEDPDLVAGALSNIFPAMIFGKKYDMRGASEGLPCLSALFEGLARRRTVASLRRQMRNNANRDATWFYLNKQAAAVGVAALCESADESPLGPIRVEISGHIGTILEWLGDLQASSA